MDREDAEEYTQALGQVVAGGWRQVALGKRLGVPAALGIGVDEWVQGRLGGYARLSIPERREAVAELTGEGMSGRQVAEVLGVAESTVRADKRPGAQNHAPSLSDPAPEGGSAAVPAQNHAPAPSAERDLQAEHVAELAEQNVKVSRSKALLRVSKAMVAVVDLGQREEEAMIHDRDGDWEEQLAASERCLARLRDAIKPSGLRRIK